jgi:hypothetical protein
MTDQPQSLFRPEAVEARTSLGWIRAAPFRAPGWTDYAIALGLTAVSAASVYCMLRG